MEAEQHNKIYALMKFDRDDLVEWIGHHLGIDGNQGSYLYHLTRTKEAFHVGTMTLDDFVEVDDTFAEELADMLLEKLRTA